jgi:hypothetical protein
VISIKISLCGAVHTILVDLPDLRASALVFISSACFFASYRWLWISMEQAAAFRLFTVFLFHISVSLLAARSFVHCVSVPHFRISARSSVLGHPLMEFICTVRSRRPMHRSGSCKQSARRNVFSCASFLSRVIVQVLDFSLGSSFSAPVCKSRRQKIFHRGPALSHLFLLQRSVFPGPL